MFRSGIVQESLALLLLIIVTVCAYANSLDGDFVFDDSRIYNSQAVQVDTFSIKSILHGATNMEPKSRPVSNLSFVLNYLFYKFDVRAYHLTNLSIHILAGIILYLFLKTTLALPVLKSRPGSASWVAFAGAAVWLVHPVQTQAVSYIVQRMTSLCALFFILSMFLYVRGRVTQNTDRRFILLGGAFLSGLLAMGSKETAITLPFFILVYEWFFLQNLQLEWLKKNKKYLVGAAVILLVVSLFILGEDPWSVIQAGYAKRDFTLFERVVTEFRVLIFYLGLLAFPHPERLSLEHDFVLSTSLINPVSTLPAIAGITGITVLAIYIAPRYRLESFCILWFLGNHFVEGSFLALELVFEHRNYLPSMMAIALVFLVLRRFISNWKVLIVPLLVVVIVFSYWTYERNHVWQNQISLWGDCVKKAPNLARAHNNLAVALKSKGRFREAIFHYRETIRLDPGFVEAYYNLGNVMMTAGKYTDAVGYYRQAVVLNPGLVLLHMSLANALFDSGQYEEARRHYLEALRIEPGNIEAKMNLDKTVMMLRSFQQRKEKT